jgi:hypothetical protein
MRTLSFEGPLEILPPRFCQVLPETLLSTTPDSLTTGESLLMECAVSDPV